MANAKTNWRNARKRGIQDKVAAVTQALVATLLDAELSPRGLPEYADVFSQRLGIRVEVKARGDSCGLALRDKQIRDYRQEPPFPLSYSLYALVPYRSRQRIKAGTLRPRGLGKKTTMVSLFRDLKTDAEIFKCLSENVPVVYLLDLRIILALRRKLGLVRGYFPDRPEEDVLLLDRTGLTDSFRDEDFSDSLSALGLRSKLYAKGTYPLQVRYTLDWPDLPLDDARLTTNLTLVTILRRSLHTKVARVVTRKTLTEV